MRRDAERLLDLAGVASMTARLDAAGWRDICLEVAAAPKCARVAAMRDIAARTGAGFGTVRRKFYAYAKSGAAALIDGRRTAALGARNPWAEAFLAYAENDLNSSMGGYRNMMRDFRRGVPMPAGIGDWRDSWRREHPFGAVPEECPADWTPSGAASTT